MFGLETLDVAIGLIFVFLLVSIMSSSIREGIEALLKTRAAYLWLGIRELLHDKDANGLAKNFYEHPLIYSLFPGSFKRAKSLDAPRFWANGRGAPSYIPARNFALALMDLAARGAATNPLTAGDGAPVMSLETLRANILNIDSAPVQRVLLSAIDTAKGDLDRVQANLEAWYDSAMDRVSGWYKRTTQWWLFWIGLVLAVTMNVNTLVIADYLYRTPAVRDSVVERADAYVKAADAASEKTSEERYREAKQDLVSLNLPIGWGPEWEVAGRGERERNDLWNFGVVPIAGWLFTAFAAAMGAPFWFDLLNKVMVIRSTVKPHEKSPEEASEDRQKKSPPVIAGLPPGGGAAPSPHPPPPPPPPVTPIASVIARDLESTVDACGGVPASLTDDEDLPAAEGGVQ